MVTAGYWPRTNRSRVVFTTANLNQSRPATGLPARRRFFTFGVGMAQIVQPSTGSEARACDDFRLMPGYSTVLPGEADVGTRRLHGTLAAAAERGPADFAELLLVPGVGARTVESLAMVAEVVHGAPCRFSDPARFSLAHGGKDRHPFPVPGKCRGPGSRRSKGLG